jgi:hypothetical protein
VPHYDGGIIERCGEAIEGCDTAANVLDDVMATPEKGDT